MAETFENLRALHSRLLSAIDGIAETDLRRIEKPGGWSVADVIAHLGDLELVYAVRIRTMLGGAGDTPLAALPQNEWVERVHGRESVAELVGNLEFLRRMNLALLRRLTDEELERSGIHPQYGLFTIRDASERIERHDAKHLAQIERIKATLGGG